MKFFSHYCISTLLDEHLLICKLSEREVFVNASPLITINHYSVCSNANKVIMAISNFLFFSHKKTPHTTKVPKAQGCNQAKTQKAKNANKRISDFSPLNIF